MTTAAKSRILIADDEIPILETTKRILEKDGYEVLTVQTADEALSAVEANGFDLVLVDYKMPGNEHLELVRVLTERYAECPVIVFTGYPSLPSAVESLHLHVFDYLPKPLDIDNLRKRVAEAVERGRLQRALRESNECLRAIADYTHGWENWVSPSGKLLWVNPAIERITGYTPDEALAMTDYPLPLIHPDDREAVARAFEGALAGESGADMRWRIRHKDGSTVWVSIAWQPAFSADGKPLGHRSSVRDISARVRAEEGLLKASRMEATATLAGGIAHDFNNLMVPVLGNASMVREDLGDDHACAPMLHDIEKAARQAASLAQQMLAYARGGKYQPRPMDLNETVQTTLRVQERAFPARVRVERAMAADLHNVRADAAQMEHVAMALCINAVEAIKGHGRVMITTRNVEVDEEFAAAHAGLKPGPHVYLSVEDTGAGMTPEVARQVFEPFFTTKFQGRGLGLAAAYGIVKNHDGHISVYSEPGRGATFKVYLPAVEDGIERRAQPPTSIPTGTETILVAEDEEMIRTMAQSILGRLGYRILLARHGSEAVRVAREFDGDIHLAILDMEMPFMGAPEAFPLLIEARPDMKVILMSGYELDARAQGVLDAGASAFLQKPFLIRELGAVIRKALEPDV